MTGCFELKASMSLISYPDLPRSVTFQSRTSTSEIWVRDYYEPTREYATLKTSDSAHLRTFPSTRRFTPSHERKMLRFPSNALLP